MPLIPEKNALFEGACSPPFVIVRPEDITVTPLATVVNPFHFTCNNNRQKKKHQHNPTKSNSKCFAAEKTFNQRLRRPIS
jgi:hypothetical protein